MRINIESVFERFDVQLSDAFCKALIEMAPLTTTRDALRAYRVFRRNAIVALAAWEDVPSVALGAERTTTASRPVRGDGTDLPSASTSQE